MDTMQPQPGWWKRNWKWAVPGLAVFLLGGCVGSMVLFAGSIMGVMKKSDVYRMAVEEARTDPRVTDLTGEPVEEGMFISGSISTSGAGGNANLSIPLSGPKGKGTLYVVAIRNAGEWTCTTLLFRPRDGGEPVDLLGEPAQP